MRMKGFDRRLFLKITGLVGLAAGANPWSGVIERALAAPAQRVTGTIRDVEHVVILMQENRSFDHYFGSLRGVRGFGDPRPQTLPGGKSVWHQPRTAGSEDYVLPFRFDAATTSAQTIKSLDHSWKGSFDLWKNHDAWIPTKGQLCMGHFTRADLPFYYALADAFTICDSYHASIHGPTNPNRLHLFTGTSGLSANNDGDQVIKNPDEEVNETADPAHDSKWFAGYAWPTYAERLQAAGISWRVYQEHDNYGDNGLAYFANFRNIAPDTELYRRGRSWVDGSHDYNAQSSEGEFLVDAFARDVAADRLPQVSWIVAPFKLCEHPEAAPALGESLVARLLAALMANPAVWAKTVFILNYDENDGFFDHVAPIQPALDVSMGASTVDIAGEVYKGVPVGLGIRVPMLAVSPWSKGGWVNSQVFDHTSVIRFLETRFGVHEPNISSWRRAVTGDLTSVFDFAGPDWTRAALPDPVSSVTALKRTSSLARPQVPAEQAMPRQEPGQRPARALPYDISIRGVPKPGEATLVLEIDNRGAAGVGLNVYSAAEGHGPWFYTIDAGKHLSHAIVLVGETYDLSLFGPNGFLRCYRGRTRDEAMLEPTVSFDAKAGELTLEFRNGASARTLVVTPRTYVSEPPRTYTMAPGTTVRDHWLIAQSAHWYDLEVTAKEEPGFFRRLAGHIETGKPSLSDPALSA